MTSRLSFNSSSHAHHFSPRINLWFLAVFNNGCTFSIQLIISSSRLCVQIILLTTKNTYSQ